MSKSGVPNNYFKNLTHRIKEGLDKMPDDLKKNSPLLYSLRLLNGYKLPANYFANLESKILQNNQSVKTKTIKLSTWVMTTAASLLLIFASVLIFSNIEKADGTINEEFVFNDDDVYEISIDEIDLDFLSELETDEEDVALMDLEDEELEVYVSYILDDFTDLELENLY